MPALEWEYEEPELGLSAEEAWRWRLLGYAILALSGVFSTSLYWTVGAAIASTM
jgi:hypothetical protein|nr:hypothetical protein [Neorhizobium tomejilense]